MESIEGLSQLFIKRRYENIIELTLVKVMEDLQFVGSLKDIENFV